MVNGASPSDRRNFLGRKPVLENEDEYDWSSDTNDYDAELRASVQEAFAKESSMNNHGTYQRRNPVEGNIDNDCQGESQRNSILRESAHETLSRLSNHFPAVVEEGADTLVWIGEPPQQPGQDDHEYSYVRRQFQMPYLMRSDTLRKLNSPKFDKFLGPMSARTERRLKKHAVHKLVQSTEKIKYYVDLSPILDDEEAMVQLTRLTVPGGALAWHQTARQFSVDTELVCGRDDLDIPPRPVYRYRKANDNTHETDIENLEQKLDSIADELKANEQRLSEENKNRAANVPKIDLYNLPLEEEYTQLRHHTAIARLLHAITGSDPKLNSAAKAWTFCMLAAYFECAHSSQISHWVVSWLLQSGNVNFIQSLPDVAYRMALSTQSNWLVRVTFSVLVGQQAMSKGIKNLAQADHQLNSRQFDRAIGCLDDDEINRIDHAAEVFSRRLRVTLDEIVVFPGLWTFSDSGCPNLSRLRALVATPEIQERVSHFMNQLKDYIRRVIYMTMSDAYPFDNKSIMPFKASTIFSAYDRVPRSLRYLTQFHWEVLHHEELYRDYLDVPNNHKIWKVTCEILKHEGLLLDSNISYVSKQTLYAAITSLNDYVALTNGLTNGNGLDGTPSRGRKRSDPDERPTTPRPYNPSKKSKTHESQASIDTMSRSQTILPVSDHELVTASSSSKMIEEEAGSDTTEDDWEEVFKPDAEQKAARFLPIRPKTVLKEVTQAMGTHSTLAEKITERPSTSSGITSKLQEMEIGSEDLEDYWWNYTGSDVAGCVGDSHSEALLPSSLKTIHEKPASDKATPIQHSAQVEPSEISEPHPFVKKPKPTVAGPLDREQTNSFNADEIVPEGLLRDLSHVLGKRLKSLLVPGYVADGSLDFDIPVNHINTLLCLGEDEYKYLPLWAGGFDDGTGGVFDDGAEVPDAPDVADGGFRGGAMGIIPGVGSSMGGSMAGSEFEDVATEVGISTVGKASRYATDGTATETVMSLDD